MFEVLIDDAGLGVVAVNGMGQTPLHMACFHLNEHMADALLKRGANENAIAGKSKSMTDKAVLGALSGLNPREIVLNCRCGEAHKTKGTHTAGETAERILSRLASAPADRAWRRRAWLVLLRERRRS